MYKNSNISYSHKIEVNRYDFLFVIYWILLLFSTTQVLGRIGLFLPVLFGILIFLKYAKNIMEFRIPVLYLVLSVFAFLFSATFKGNPKDLENAFISILLLFSNFGLAFLIARVNKTAIYPLAVFGNLFIALFVFVMRILGFSVIDAVQVLFQSSSYHLIAWLLLLFNGILLFDLSKNDINKIKIYSLSFTLFFAMLALQGRSGLVIGVFILIACFWYYSKKYFVVICVIISLAVMIVGVKIDISTISVISSDLSERGSNLGPRELIYACYYSNLDWTDLLVGFNKIEVAGECIKRVYPSVLGSTESSLLSLVSETGVFSIILLGILLKNMFGGGKKKKMFVPLLLSITFRSISGDYLFSSVFDWIIYFLAFNEIFSFRMNSNDLSERF